MAKGKKSVFFCQNCGHEENKWLGQCPMCREWNTFVEEPVSFSKSASAKQIKDAEVVALKHVETDQEERIKTKIEELDRVLGGGIVPGSLLLVGEIMGLGNLPFFCRCVRDCVKISTKCFIYQGRSHSNRSNSGQIGWENSRKIYCSYVRQI